ncbi:hypothetical protein XELAEV_18009567mg [Xenopus laevis]|uniref:Uncharacterized protein n=1 Tax=Xenopus laevis TaxID=8355 RepID=A0A974I0N6_XENLA|nr:hypothetical protein XELAEV_18009567mg [Xenopus laevis]
MGQGDAGVDQIKLGIKCRGRLEQDSKRGLEQERTGARKQERTGAREDWSKRGLEQNSKRGDSERGVQGRVGKQESGTGKTRSVQGEVRARYKVEQEAEVRNKQGRIGSRSRLGRYKIR